MAFGDDGEFVVRIGNIPFRVDAESQEAARQKVTDTLQSAPELFSTRLNSLGIDKKDLDALLLLQQQQGQSTSTGRERFLEGLTPADAGQSTFDRFALGAGRTFSERFRGVRQILAEAIGDTEAVETLAQLDKEEEEIFNRLEVAGFDAADIGQLTPDLLAFLIPSAAGAQLTRMGAAAAGAGTGLLPTAVTGALLGAAQVQQAGESLGRSTKAALGAAGSLILPAGARLLGGLGSLITKIPGSFRMNNRLWVRWHGLRSSPSRTQNIADDAIAMADEGMSEGQQIIGRTALDYVGEVVRSLPATEARGLKDHVGLGIIRNALTRATQPNSSGVNVFNPAVWEQQTARLAGSVGSMFTKTEHTQMVGAVNVLAREMQNIPRDIAPEIAEQAATALLRAAPRAKPIIAAMQAARNPEVKLELLRALADVGALATSELMRGGTAAVGERVLAEPGESLGQAAELGGRILGRNEN